MRTLPLAFLLFLSACTGAEPDDTGPVDTGEADADTDADTDSDTDTDTDTDTDVDLWEWCPDPSSAVGDPTWEGRLEATEDAVWCVRPEDHRNLEQALAAKAMVRVVEGSYPVPLEEGEHDLGVPMCVAFPDGTGLASGEAGTATTLRASRYGMDYARLTWLQPMSGAAAGEWSLEAALAYETEQGGAFAPLTLDGGALDGYGGGFRPMLHANASGTWEAMSRNFDTCHGSDTWREDVHAVTFAGGEAELVVHIGESMAGTEPSAFVRATGSLDGTAFDQRSYWSLVYAPEHHHFVRHYAVLFDAPVGEACGLRFEGLEAGTESTGETVSLVDCDLQKLEDRAVTGVTYTRED